MKAALLGFLFCLGFTMHALAVVRLTPASFQKDANGMWFYEKVTTVDNISKKELYQKLKTWIVSNVKTVDNNILFDDANYEMIVTTPTLAIPDAKHGLVTKQGMNFKLTLSFKDNKFKAFASSFIYFGYANGGTIGGPIETFEGTKGWLNDINEKFDEAFASFAKVLAAAGTTKSAGSDW